MSTVIGKDEKGDDAYICVFKEKDGKVKIRLWSAKKDGPVALSAKEVKQLVAKIEKCLE